MTSLTPADFVIEAAADACLTALAALEAVRTTSQVDPVASSTQRASIQTLYDAAPDLVADVSTAGVVAAGIVAIARALGDAIAPASAAEAFEAIATDTSFSSDAAATGPYVTPSSLAAAANREALNRTLRLASLVAYAEAIARIPLTDRQSAITLRANVAEYFGGELDELSATDIDLYRAIGSLRDATIAYLSRAIIDLAPVMSIEVNMRLPSLYWAWRLYADPDRSSELVSRNHVQHPSFMPLMLEASAK